MSACACVLRSALARKRPYESGKDLPCIQNKKKKLIEACCQSELFTVAVAAPLLTVNTEPGLTFYLVVAIVVVVVVVVGGGGGGGGGGVVVVVVGGGGGGGVVVVLVVVSGGGGAAAAASAVVVVGGDGGGVGVVVVLWGWGWRCVPQLDMVTPYVQLYTDKCIE